MMVRMTLVPEGFEGRDEVEALVLSISDRGTAGVDQSDADSVSETLTKELKKESESCLLSFIVPTVLFM